ncbi:ABC transporter ATP-binding protein [Candidatus Methylacidithermus pantelleriae]|uniref:Peptide import ATP-binding protein BOV_A0348 n=1 Tax=Candidatus Methylacidithermus pantelleriae TaxID=2744239 RepID=A0A8J2FTM5_9BACT|nr:ABC transporter ATP-binding protein [Candidatus Methylacidithermus pantelleriae]CAF0705404.1 Putative peptide import ATP-binding protein BOV_A0348 [Candidatus Methylacidithermus pantelleriae]
MSARQEILQVHNLTVSFSNRDEEVIAVNGVSFTICEGEKLAMVGESGSGKSVTALSLARLLPTPPALYRSGQILWLGEDVLQMDSSRLRRVRGKGIAYIFQEPSTSLNPVLTIGFQIEEALALHRPDVSDRREEVIRLLREVGIPSPELRYRAYPHELSGGMQQRVMIAMALACRPKLLVADEPTTALDTTVQAQIMELLRKITAKEAMAVLFITHNFGLVKDFADRTMVMFRGKIVEQGPTRDILHNPSHPYTQALLSCVPRLGEHKKRLATIDYDQLELAMSQP